MSDPEKCPGCGGDLGKADNCRVCAYYAILDERPNPDELLQQRRDMDQLGRDFERYSACQHDHLAVREWLNELERRRDVVGFALIRAWVDLVSEISKDEPDFLDLLDRLTIAEYEIRVAQLRRNALWESLKPRMKSRR